MCGSGQRLVGAMQGGNRGPIPADSRVGLAHTILSSVRSARKHESPSFHSGFVINRATSYSPTHLRVQYHRG